MVSLIGENTDQVGSTLTIRIDAYAARNAAAQGRNEAAEIIKQQSLVNAQRIAEEAERASAANKQRSLICKDTPSTSSCPFM